MHKKNTICRLNCGCIVKLGEGIPANRYREARFISISYYYLDCKILQYGSNCSENENTGEVGDYEIAEVFDYKYIELLYV